jgi:hypothetical protein
VAPTRLATSARDHEAAVKRTIALAEDTTRPWLDARRRRHLVEPLPARLVAIATRR